MSKFGDALRTSVLATASGLKYGTARGGGNSVLAQKPQTLPLYFETAELEFSRPSERKQVSVGKFERLETAP